MPRYTCGGACERRRRLLSALAALPLCSRAQAAGDDRITIAVLANGAGRGPNSRDRLESLFRRRAQRHGWTLAFEYRAASFSAERLAGLVEATVAARPRLVVCDDLYSAMAAGRGTRDIPVLFTASADPVAAGLVRSLARPGGNLTGVVTYAPIEAKSVEIAHDAFPRAGRIGCLVHPQEHGQIFQRLGAAADALGVRAQAYDVGGIDDVRHRLREISTSSIDAAIVVLSSTVWNQRRVVIDWLQERRIPALFPRSQFVDDGGLVSYGPDLSRSDAQLSDYFERILLGASPGDLPVLAPDRFELAINLRTARSIGFDFSRAFLRRADRVVE